MSRALRRFHRINPSLPSLTGGIAMRIQPMGHIDNQIWLMTFDYISFTTGTPNSNAESNLANAWITNCGTAMRGCMAADVAFDTIKVTCLNLNTRQPFFAGSLAGMGNGTVAGTHIPSEMAMVLSKYTAFKGQHGRGRAYIPGCPSTFVTPGTDANRINATGQTAVNAFGVALLNTVSDGTNTYTIGVTQRTTSGAPTQFGAVLKSAATGGLVIQTLLGTARRRRIGRGK